MKTVPLSHPDAFNAYKLVLPGLQPQRTGVINKKEKTTNLMLIRIFVLAIVFMTGMDGFADTVVKNLDHPASLAGPWKIHAGDGSGFADPDHDDSSWDTINLPGNLVKYIREKTGGFSGILWIKKSIYIGKKIPRGDIGLILGRIANADEAYFNGVKIGATGSLPPHEFSMWYHPRYYKVSESLIRYGETNVIAVKVWYYIFAGIDGDLSIAGLDEWTYGKNLNNFMLIAMSYVIIASGVPVFLVFLLIFIRRPSSQEYLFYMLQLWCGLIPILELCNYWNIYGNSLNRFLILGIGWASLGMMHTIFLHRIYELKRKKIEILLWLYLAVIVVLAVSLSDPAWIRAAGIMLIVSAIALSVYIFSCHFYALYKKRPYAKFFFFFGSAAIIAATHDGVFYLLKLLGIDAHAGPLFQYMIFPYGAAALYTGATLVLVSRFVSIMDETREVNENLEIKVQVRNSELREARDALWGEMELAKRIQTVLLPKNPSIPGYEITAYMKAAEHVGGDYYDIINAEGRDWLIIGDVSGHGVPAGLIMMMVQTAIQTVVRRFPNIKPSELLSMVNSAIRYNMRQMGEDRYMTITAFAILMGGRLYFSGLHQDIMVYRAAAESVESIGTEGTLLGIQEDIKELLGDIRLELDRGDCMLLYTDGITEAWKKGSISEVRTPEQDMYGEKKLLEVLGKYGSRTPHELRDAILRSLNDYECTDDITLVIVKRTASRGR